MVKKQAQENNYPEGYLPSFFKNDEIIEENCLAHSRRIDKYIYQILQH